MKDYDVVIIGCGASGLQAAVHSSRSKALTLVLGSEKSSALGKAHIENYLGLGRVDGMQILASGIEAARNFGADLLSSDAISLSRDDADDGFPFRVKIEDGSIVKTRAAVLALGVSRQKLGVPGEERLIGSGVSYCSLCDCRFYRNMPVAVVGGGSSARESVETMARYASKVYFIHGDSVHHDLSPLEKIEAVPSWPVEVTGREKVEGLRLADGRLLEVKGVFIELGSKGALGLLFEMGLFPDENGHLDVDRSMRISVPGLFACGDLTGHPYQLAKAVGEGCVAGYNAAIFAREVAWNGYGKASDQGQGTAASDGKSGEKDRVEKDQVEKDPEGKSGEKR